MESDFIGQEVNKFSGANEPCGSRRLQWLAPIILISCRALSISFFVFRRAFFRWRIVRIYGELQDQNARFDATLQSAKSCASVSLRSGNESGADRRDDAIAFNLRVFGHLSVSFHSIGSTSDHMPFFDARQL
jgi:hypothetical protein